MRFAHIADTQLGFHSFDGRYSPQRERDFFDVFTAACEICVTKRVDFALFVGDITHFDGTRRRPLSPATYQTLRQGMDILHDAKIPAILISGNHDTPRVSYATHPLRTVEDMPNVKLVIDEPLVTDELHAIPWVHKEPLTAEDFRADSLICAVHAPCPVVDKYSTGAREFHPEWAEHYAYVALGDWHKPTAVGSNGQYCGSLERTSISDALTPTGCLFVDLNADSDCVVGVEWWDSPSRKVREWAWDPKLEAGLDDILLNVSESDPDEIHVVRFSGIDPSRLDARLIQQAQKNLPFLRFVFESIVVSEEGLIDFGPQTVRQQWDTYAAEAELSKEERSSGHDVLTEATGRR